MNGHNVNPSGYVGTGKGLSPWGRLTPASPTGSPVEVAQAPDRIVAPQVEPTPQPPPNGALTWLKTNIGHASFRSGSAPQPIGVLGHTA